MPAEPARRAPIKSVSLRPRYGLCERVAMDTVQMFLACAKSKEPPIHIEEMARAHGFQVVKLFTAGEEFSGMVSPRHKLIGVNGNHHRHRQRFTVAHEIAHVLLKHPPESRCTTREIAIYNIEADVCASELLIPRALLIPILRRSAGSPFLARTFDVSEEAIERKMRFVDSTGALPNVFSPVT